ncbi:hypothetical protein [Paraclostridium sordellii]|uniref:hypothetical protein n=1 Tax=Paraclostridium sordellii TaxID=1505 RepID=UPI0030D47F54
MIRVSIGTAIELGIAKGKNDIPPTTAYIMIGNRCNNKCSFCSQSMESSSRKDKYLEYYGLITTKNVY